MSGVLHWQKLRVADAEAAVLDAAARQLCESNNYALGWQRYNDAVARYPDRPSLRVARERCGMRWLRDIRVQVGKETFTGIVNQVQPVLAEGAASASEQRLADLHAHMGWADYLRTRDGAVGLNPRAHYEKALAVESSNIYAHAMLGHLLTSRQQLTQAGKQHFAAALASGRDKEFVRKLHFAALLEYGDVPKDAEALRAASEMRRNGETADEDLHARLWRVYVGRLHDGIWRQQRHRFMPELREADAPETFRWLFPENEVREDRHDLWRFLMASLEQADGQRDAALARYNTLRADLESRRSGGNLLTNTIVAIEQLQGICSELQKSKQYLKSDHCDSQL